ncbi:MAG TPA: tyrosine-type recombinase/integrase [Bryobacteraceae bacterium]|nr:tyrosine-type recombinase/integrase [Bryobacteraceae bacterium]
MRRRRFQKGSLQLRRHADRRVWVVLYYDERGDRRYYTLGFASEMNKSQANEKCQEFMREINGGDRTVSAVRPTTVIEFLEEVYLPFYLGKWKESTAGTSENRIRHHIGKELGRERLADLTLAKLQKFLEQKAASGLSFSVVDHLRWDLSSMFDMAVSEQVIPVNPTASLYTPKAAKRSEGHAMSAEQVEVALGVVDDREKVILRLAVFAGMRPGELLAIQREHVKKDASVIEIRHRVYRGKFASPKNGLVRTVAVPPSTATLLRQWMENAVEPKPESFVFAGETGQPLWRSSLLEDYIKAKLEPVGLGWVNFQVMRRTHASLGHHAKVDPKVSADQRGHGIGVALDVYTKSSMKDRATAAKKLEDSVLPKAVRARKRPA